MDSKQAIDLLHNNQYQKHLGNGEYDYIHPLTDAECKGIESLIQQQQQQIEQLKCCGNCLYGEETRCPSDAKIINDRCSKWQKVGD